MRKIERMHFRSVKPKKNYQKTFSICTMVNDWVKYKQSHRHWLAKGFRSPDCEYLVCDNTRKKQFDGYQAGRMFLDNAQGKYIILVHLDSRPLDNKQTILNLLKKLDAKDPSWGVIGNAGVQLSTGESIILGLEMPGCPAQECKKEFIPVHALDENLLIIRADSRLTFSHDLKGYHFYGLDISDLARRIGKNCYVTKLRWFHNSHGTMNQEFHDARIRVEVKMSKYLSAKIWGTNCTFLSLAPSLFVKAWARARSYWILRNNEHHTVEEKKAAWDAGRKELLFYPAYLLLWLFKKTGLEKRRNKRLYQSETLCPLNG